MDRILRAIAVRTAETLLLLFLLMPSSVWGQYVTIPVAANRGASMTSLGLGSVVVSQGPLTTTATPPAALANFGMTLNGILVTEAGVSASTPTAAARLFVDYSTSGGTDSGIAIVNPNSGPLSLTVQLNSGTGSSLPCPSLTVPARGHTALFASQMCKGIITDPFLGTLTLTSSLTSTPFVATTLMSGTNAYGEPLYNSLPVAVPNAPPSGNHLYFSQFADGGGFSTVILLMNVTSNPIRGTVSFSNDAGQPVALNFGPTIGSTSTLTYSIPANGMQKFSTTGTAPGTQAGAVVVISTSGALPSGAVVFSSYNHAGGLASLAGVLNSPVTASARMYVERSNSPLSRDTGVAIINPGATTANVQLRLASLDGTFTAANSISIAPNNHLAAFISQSVLMGAAAASIPANFQGVLTLTSTVAIAPVTLRFTPNQRQEDLYSTLPVTDLDIPPTGSLYLPQLADGGGFATQIILVNTGSSSGNVTITFLNDNGNATRIPFTSSGFPALRQVAGKRLLLGTAVDAGEASPNLLATDSVYAETIKTQYSMLQGENAMKWQFIHPASKTYNYDPGDELVNFAQANGMSVRGHTLVWHQQNPYWLTQQAGTATPETMASLLQSHMNNVMTHYKGRVFAWDVVNEPINDAGTGLRDSIWHNQPGIGASGAGYIEQAFRWAHAADPDALLFLNEAGIEGAGPKFEYLYNTVKDFVARGVPIHGVGMQMHIENGGYPASAELASNIQRLGALGLQVHITEMDVRVWLQADGTPWAGYLLDQAQTYQRILTVCLQNQACTGLQTWGFTDRHSWIGKTYYVGFGAALPLDLNYAPKAAFFSMIGALQSVSAGGQ
jgi:endo-1,4-beta-xylanase